MTKLRFLTLPLTLIVACGGSLNAHEGEPSYDWLRKECEWLAGIDDLDPTTLARWESFKREVTPGFVVHTLEQTGEPGIQSLLLGLAAELGIDGLVPRATELLSSSEQQVVRASLLYLSLEGSEANTDDIVAVTRRPWGHTGIVDAAGDALSTILPPEDAIKALEAIVVVSPDMGVADVVAGKVARLRAITEHARSEEAVMDALLFGSSDDARWAATYARRRPRTFYPHLRSYLERLKTASLAAQDGERVPSLRRREFLAATLELLRTEESVR